MFVNKKDNAYKKRASFTPRKTNNNEPQHSKQQKSEEEAKQEELLLKLKQKREELKEREKQFVDAIYTHGPPKLGMLVNFRPTTIEEEDSDVEKSAVDLFFIDNEDGSIFKVTKKFKPYFYVAVKPGFEQEVDTFLKRQYGELIANIEHVDKEDLEMPNHLAGKLAKYLKIRFHNVSQLLDLRKVILPLVEKNRKTQSLASEFNLHEVEEDDDSSNSSTQLAVKSSLSRHLDCLESITDIREYDVKYHVRAAIDKRFRVGYWYKVDCIDGKVELDHIDNDDRANPKVCAFDIEVTKEPFMFPDAKHDRIMMISYMIDGQGYLIVNREEISEDIENFEYNPKPEYEGSFEVMNVANEKALIVAWFEHMKRERPAVYVTYNGDGFDFPYVDARAKIYDLDMRKEIGFYKNTEDMYQSSVHSHMDCFYWVKRDSYLPQGSHGLKAVTKAKLGYNPVEIDPENIVRFGRENPQYLASYSVSDAVSTYYLYMKYVHTFIFSLCTIIPMPPDDVLRKGSGTLCETLLMVEAFSANVICPNRYKGDPEKMYKGHLLDSDTYIGGHVEALKAGIYRADLAEKFDVDQAIYKYLIDNVDKALKHAVEVEHKISISDVKNYEEIKSTITSMLQSIHDNPKRIENPKIYHFDVGAMYPNIILTNRLQPMAIVNETTCASCVHNKPSSNCQRKMDWHYRAEYFQASKSEYEMIKEQLNQETFPPRKGDKQAKPRTFEELGEEEQRELIKKRLGDYSKKVYNKKYGKETEIKQATICQRENPFYVDTVKLFRDRRYEFKEKLGYWKQFLKPTNSAETIDKAKRMIILYDSLQLAHKCILNSFYGYVMRKAARWYSMEMAGVVTYAGAQIIKMARKIIDGIGITLELDTDGIWCAIPASFPENFVLKTDKKSITISYPCMMLNADVNEKFTNHQYQDLENKEERRYKISSVCSIFFEVDGPYRAMVLPASKEEGKGIKKRYAVFHMDGTIAELKGFEIKRRGELKLIKLFQSRVFDGFLKGNTLEEAYQAVGEIANQWLEVLHTEGRDVEDDELFELITESSNMSKSLQEYGTQKSARITTAKRIAELFGEQMIKDKGLVCNYVVCKKPDGAPVSERVIPVALFLKDKQTALHYLRIWLKEPSLSEPNIRQLLDWEYYKERLGSAIQKIITIPAFYQHIANPVPRVSNPEWVKKSLNAKQDTRKQLTLTSMFSKAAANKDDMEEDDDGSSSSSASDKEKQNDDIIDLENLGDVVVPTRKSKKVLAKRSRAQISISDEEKSDEENKQVTQIQKRKFAQLSKKFSSPHQNLDSSFFEHKDYGNWLKNQKDKWREQREIRKRRKTGALSYEEIQNETQVRQGGNTIGNFLRQQNVALQFGDWQILEVRETEIPGLMKIFVLISTGTIQMMDLTVSRELYVNWIKSPEGSNNAKLRLTLPRSRPCLELRKFEVSEDEFISDKELHDLFADPNVEGVYESHTPLLFKAVMQLGCVCSVQPTSRQKIGSKHLELTDFVMKTNNVSYIEKQELKKIFIYASYSATEAIIGVFFFASLKAKVYIVQPYRFQQDKLNLGLDSIMQDLIEQHDLKDNQPFSFDYEVVVNKKAAFAAVKKDIEEHNLQARSSTVVIAQTPLSLPELCASIPILNDYPVLRKAHNPKDNQFPKEGWMQSGSKKMITQVFAVNSWFERQVESAKYGLVPVGNMEDDNYVNLLDLMYARELRERNHLLWVSETSKPDLGGYEDDDNTVLSSILQEEADKAVEISKPGFYHNICVEINLSTFAVSTILHSKNLLEHEPVSQIWNKTNAKQAQPQVLDENQMCASAYEVLQEVVSRLFHEVGANDSRTADAMLSNVYRWAKSPHSKLYDPALYRVLLKYMKQVFVQLLSLLKKLGSRIIYANFNRIIVETSKDSVDDAENYINYVLKTVITDKSNLFFLAHMIPTRYYSSLLWLDPLNNVGVVTKSFESSQSSSAAKKKVEVALNITKVLPNAASKHLQAILLDYVQQMEITKSRLLSEYSSILADELVAKHEAFAKNFITTVCTPKLLQVVPEIQRIPVEQHDRSKSLVLLRNEYSPEDQNVALEFVKSICHFLSLDPFISDEVTNMKSSLLRVIQVGEFSKKAQYKNPLKTLVLTDVTCTNCGAFRDLDLCRDSSLLEEHDGLHHRWECNNCDEELDLATIENRLIELLQRKFLSYQVQDLKCTKCGQVKADHLSDHCECSGRWACRESKQSMESFLDTVTQVSKFYKFSWLEQMLKYYSVSSSPAASASNSSSNSS